MVFGEVLSRVDGRRRTLVFYNAAECPTDCERVIDYVGVHDVDIEHATDSTLLEPTVVVEDCGTRLSSDSIQRVVDYIDGWEAGLSADLRPPSLFENLDETIFRSTNKRQLVLASRLIETRAVQAGEGRLAAGFERLSLARPQLSFYTALPSGVTIELYGEPDWLPPADSRIEAYNPTIESHANYWWVLFDGTDTPRQHAALLAEKNPDETYTGFWTYRQSLVEAISEIVDGFDAHRVVAGD